MLTPYQFASNSPISGIDLDGLEYANASTGEGLGPLSRKSLESSAFTIVDSRTIEAETILAYLPEATISASRLTKTGANGAMSEPISHAPNPGGIGLSFDGRVTESGFYREFNDPLKEASLNIGSAGVRLTGAVGLGATVGFGFIEDPLESEYAFYFDLGLTVGFDASAGLKFTRYIPTGGRRTSYEDLNIGHLAGQGASYDVGFGQFDIGWGGNDDTNMDFTRTHGSKYKSNSVGLSAGSPAGYSQSVSHTWLPFRNDKPSGQ